MEVNAALARFAGALKLSQKRLIGPLSETSSETSSNVFAYSAGFSTKIPTMFPTKIFKVHGSETVSGHPDYRRITDHGQPTTDDRRGPITDYRLLLPPPPPPITPAPAAVAAPLSDLPAYLH